MFTGIVATYVPLSFVSHTSALTRYALTCPPDFIHNLKIGASVSVHGICQTVVAIENNTLTFDAIAETLACTTVSDWQVGSFVNVERSLKIGDEIGGHLLSGHVIGTATIEKIEYPSEEQAILTFSCSSQWMKYIFPKGYIAINGVSLTVGKTDSTGRFTVNLIPETRRMTTFGQATVGEKVNIEIDSQTQTIVDTVERVISSVGADLVSAQN